MVDRFFNEEAKRRKFAQAEAERKAAAAAEERERQRQEARKKPHAASSWDDPSFCRRVLRRAARHAEIGRQILAGNYKTTPKPTARQRWDRAIEAAAAVCGGDKMKAVALANRQNPGLRESMLKEINEGRSRQ